MLTTIRLDKEIQKQLKLRSAETGKSQLELANQYILEGLRNNKPSNMSLEEMDKLLAHDKPEGNNLRKFANLVSNSCEVDEVKEKKESYRGM